MAEAALSDSDGVVIIALVPHASRYLAVDSSQFHPVQRVPNGFGRVLCLELTSVAR
jgi:hypothetical protein